MLLGVNVANKKRSLPGNGRAAAAPAYVPPGVEMAAPTGPSTPAALQARLYPSNEVAT